MKGQEIQKKLFEMVKARLPKHVILADDLAELLSISSDSVYRRLRGEKMLTLDELAAVCARYSVSFDALTGNAGSAILFHTSSAAEKGLGEWLEGIAADMKNIVTSSGSHIWYYAKDVPLFHYFAYPEVAAFKSFFWNKVILTAPGTDSLKFELGPEPMQASPVGNKLLELYNAIPSTEIWNEETLESMLLQAGYCVEAGLFGNADTAARLLLRLRDMVDHVEAQVRLGSKFLPGKAPETGNGNFRFFRNEVILGDNTILVESGDYARVYLTYNILNFLQSDDAAFCARTRLSLENVTRRSTLISGVSEKERVKFFTRMRTRLDAFEKKML